MSETLAPSFEDLRRQALALRAAGRHRDALNGFRRAQALRPGDGWTRNDIALEHLALGEASTAQALAAELSADLPGFAPACRTLALAHRAEGRHEQALEAFGEAARRDPRDLWNRHDTAVSLRALRRPDEAESALRNLIRATPLAHVLRALGELSREAGAGENAFALLQAASLLQPDDPWFALDAARQAAALGEAAKAERVLDALQTAHPRFAPAALERARLAQTPASIAAALDGLRGVAALTPGNEALVCAQAELLRRSGRPLDAETVLARHLAHHPASVAALRALARAARERGDREAVTAHLKAALALLPGDATLRFEWILALRESGAGEEAERALETLCAEPAPPVDALFELHRLRLRRFGPDEARALLHRARALDPAHPRALLLLGDDRRLAGDAEAAASFYREALRHRPGFVWALIGLAALARAEGRRDEALRLLGEAASGEPLEGQAQIEAAALCRDEGAFEEARRWLALVPDTSPRRAEAEMANALILRAEGRWPAAAEAFEAVARDQGRPDALAEAADDWIRAGENARADDALAHLATAAPRHPAFLEAQARRALMRDEMGRARDLFASAASEDPGRLGAWLGAARAEALGGELPTALDRLAEMDRRFAPRPESAALRADLLRQGGHLAQAREVLSGARARHPHHAALWQQEQIERIEAGNFAEVQAALDDPPPALRAEAGRWNFVRSLLESARWNFDAAMEAGEAALTRLPGDGWVRNRLIHAALLGLDLDRAGRHLRDLARLEAGGNRLKGKSINASQSHYGQLYDDFRMDADALETLRRAHALPEPQLRLDAFSAAVLAFPDSTIAALQWFIELRRQNGAPMRTGLPVEKGRSPIPPTIHQFWDEPEPPADVLLYGESWRQENEGYGYRLWNGAEAEDFLRSQGLSEALVAFRRARQPAMKADLFRLALLSREGGIYADADDRCLRPIRPLLPGNIGFLAYQEDLGSLGNNILAARPNHPIVSLALDLACEAVNRGDGDILWLSTGPGLLSRAAARLLAARPADVADVAILDRHTLSRFAAIHCLTAYKSTERHWSRTAFGGTRPKSPVDNGPTQTRHGSFRAPVASNAAPAGGIGEA